MAKVKELKPDVKDKFKVHVLAGQTVSTSDLPPSIRSGIDRRITRAPVAQPFQGMGYDAVVIEKNATKEETPEFSARIKLLDGLKASGSFVRYVKVMPLRSTSKRGRAKSKTSTARVPAGPKKFAFDGGIEQRQYGSRRGRVLETSPSAYRVELYTRMGWRTYKFKRTGLEGEIVAGDAVECRIFSVEGKLGGRVFKIKMPVIDERALEEKFMERAEKSLDALEARLREEGGT